MGRTPEDRPPLTVVGSAEWLRQQMADSKPVDPDAPIQRTLQSPDSFRSMMKRKAAGIVFSASLLTALAVTALTPTSELPAISSEVDGHCPPADPIQVFPSPAPKPSI